MLKKYIGSSSPTSQTENETSKVRVVLTTDHPSEEPSSSIQNQGEIIIHGAAADETNGTDGQELILGTIDAQPISSSPSLSEIESTRAHVVQEAVMLVGQLA